MIENRRTSDKTVPDIMSKRCTKVFQFFAMQIYSLLKPQGNE